MRTGKRIADCGLRTFRLRIADRGLRIEERSFNPQSRGFTLLELMIVISIIIILVMVVLPQYNKVVMHAKETQLRTNLFEMRKLLDQYAADKGKMAQTLDELVSAGYLHKVPVDPMTGEPNWVVEMGEDPNASDGGQGISKVCSASPDTSSEGTPYSDCENW